MKNKRILSKLPQLTACLGVFGFGLRWMFYLTATDDRGLLVSGHFLGVILGIFTLGVLAFLILSVWKLEGSRAYRDNFFPSVPSAIGHCLAALGLLILVLGNDPSMAGTLGLLWKILGFASVPCLVAAGFFRMKGKKPFFLLHILPCLFLVFHIVNQYQSWSSQPQTQNWIYSLLGNMTLTLFAFYTAAFETGVAHRRMHLFTGLASVFFCLTGLYTAGMNFWFHLGAAAWAGTSLCTLEPKARTPKFRQTPPAEKDGTP